MEANTDTTNRLHSTAKKKGRFDNGFSISDTRNGRATDASRHGSSPSARSKGTAFSEEERTEFGLRGLLPPHVETLDEQVVRAYEAFQKKTTTSNGISTCELYRTRMRFSSTDSFLIT
jgi:hypothetical protein